MLLQDWLLLLLLIAVSMFALWRGFASGRAVLVPALLAVRKTHPTGFWAIQCFWMFSILMWLWGAVYALIGDSLPP
jgi:hypothetical protein